MIIFPAGWRGNSPPYGEVIISIFIAGWRNIVPPGGEVINASR